MKRSGYQKEKSHNFKVVGFILPMVFVILIAAVILACLVLPNLLPEKKDEAETVQEETLPEVPADTTESAPRQAYPLRFLDAHKQEFEMMVNPEVEFHPYDLSRFFNDGINCAYDDDVYTSRRGIDVSTYQGWIDWDAVAASGISFVFLRLGYRGYGPEGTIMQDEAFDSNITGAQAAGLDVGAYFFSQAVNEYEAQEEARACMEWLAPYTLQLPLVFDSEHVLDDVARTDDVSGEQFTQNAIAFCELVKAEGGYSPAIYCNLKWEAFTYDLTKLAAYPIWYADYEPLPQTPYRFTWWQYTETGYCPGIEGEVDLDIEIRPK